MEREGQWWKSQLAADIHQSLRIKELKLPTYKSHSPQIGMRRYFADLLAVLSNRYQLCPAARHLAVYLLDLFMDHYDVAVRQLYIIALSCLLLASKFEEKEATWAPITPTQQAASTGDARRGRTNRTWGSQCLPPSILTSSTGDKGNQNKEAMSMQMLRRS